MGYALMKLRKLKTNDDLSDAYKHNTRIYRVENADPMKQHLNQEVIPLDGLTYAQASDQAVEEMREIGALTGKVRKNAVRGFEVMMTFPREDTERMPLNEWVQRNVEWLEETFNPPGKKIHYKDPATNQDVEREIKSNVRSVILHMDEDTPHLHAFIVPIDQKGQLNAYSYTKDRTAFVMMQDSYAKAMSDFGLRRGTPHSVATPEERTAYYAKMREPLYAELPEPMPGEELNAYRERANETYRTALVHGRAQNVRMHQQEVEKLSRASSVLAEAYKERTAAREESAKLAEKWQEMDKQGKKLARAMGEDSLTPEILRHARHVIEKENTIEEAVKACPDRTTVEHYQASRQFLLEWMEHEEKLRKEKERRRMAVAEAGAHW